MIPQQLDVQIFHSKKKEEASGKKFIRTERHRSEKRGGGIGKEKKNQYRESHLMQKVQFVGKSRASARKYSIAALRAETK